MNSCIGKASSFFTPLTARVWDIKMLSICTKAKDYCSCVCILCYKVLKHWLCLVCKRWKLIPFTYNAFAVTLKLHSNKRSPTRKCWDVLVLPPCTLPSDSTDFAGSCSEGRCWANPQVSVVWKVGSWQTQPRFSKIVF